MHELSVAALVINRDQKAIQVPIKRRTKYTKWGRVVQWMTTERQQ